MKGMINTINEYNTEDGRSPYSDWLASLKETKVIAAVLSRVDRMELGLLGDAKSVGDGVMELRIHLNPGYRVDYAREDKTVYLLLCGGDKSSQKKDIKLAKQYWAQFKSGENHG